ncbi:hydrogenase nickel incorporation protein HypB [Desulfotomaculum copahuensis]|uniref:Hydrogenase accessory protein HypB n=1 Tax=Desulfotomaculum copahuensis TaxID=1838280 RepID=A0A1B7LHA0_9FIRM|nr:hydrogenase nickel incorporation protein HypB [Desulfotomaculum copahuensis]OAT85573.1 hydrogenase accessory protein HypB [Desulfotomaculum copahuensis]
MKVIVARPLLQANDVLARQNAALLGDYRLAAVNLLSSPGSGKTTLLEKTITYLHDQLRVGVVEGDIYTARDAERIAGLGAAVVQINTSGTCHLNAGMVAGSLEELPLAELDLLFIENVGNLVCPASFDLGEDCKVVLLSVAEGGDKPAKYPLAFQEARAAVITKVDLLPYTDFDLAGCLVELRSINPGLEIFITSARNGEGIAGWCRWLQFLVSSKRSPDEHKGGAV